MITRLDHVVIAVPDIATACAAYLDLGFEIAPGGRHPAIGTQNALVRFGLDYLELIAIEDPVQARLSGPFGAELADFVERSSGFVGFALASSDLDGEARALAAINQVPSGPFAMDRVRPDGRRVAWRLVIPGGSPWRQPWPFLIEWESKDQQRLAWDAPGIHPNASVGIAALTVLVADIAAARQLYEHGLGLVADTSDAKSASYTIGTFALTVTEPASPQQAHDLATYGAGPFEMSLRVRDLETARARTQASARSDKLAVAAERALGARITLVAC